MLSLLGVEEKQFVEGCCALSRKFLDGTTLTPRTKASCENIKDALAKDLFNNCFSWIVRKLNITLAPQKQARFTSIGLLDIFGFEDFKINSIEQFCINYTNEKLQNLYISYVFKAEKIIFENEGLSQHIGLISYDDNDVIIMMLDKPPGGIFHLIDSNCKMSKGNAKDDEKLVTEIKKFHEKDKNFFSHRLKRDIFGIKHTAKDVEYTITGFVEKNKDELPGNLVECLKTGEKDIMKIFQKKLTHDEVIEVKAKNPKDKYLGYKFRAEMQELMDELLSCECNFVRCIKPNAQKQADYWIEELALKQIKYLGVLDSIKVRRESLPVRRKFINFYEKYQDLDTISKQKNTSFVKLREQQGLNWRSLCENILKSIVIKEKEEVLTGKTRVFMSVNFQNYLRELLDEKQHGKKIAMQKLAESIKSYVFAVKWDHAR